MESHLDPGLQRLRCDRRGDADNALHILRYPSTGEVLEGVEVDQDHELGMNRGLKGLDLKTAGTGAGLPVDGAHCIRRPILPAAPIPRRIFYKTMTASNIA